MTIERSYNCKTVNYVKRGKDLSGLILQGSFLLPDTKAFYYENDKELADLVIRVTESYQTKHEK